MDHFYDPANPDLRKYQILVQQTFYVGIGINPNLCIRSLQGPFPFFTSTDRTMAEDALRGGFTNGLFANGEISARVYVIP